MAVKGRVTPELESVFLCWGHVTVALLEATERSGIIVDGAPHDSVPHAIGMAILSIAHGANVIGALVTDKDVLAELRALEAALGGE
jgi:hypothetical protein